MLKQSLTAKSVQKFDLTQRKKGAIFRLLAPKTSNALSSDESGRGREINETD